MQFLFIFITLSGLASASFGQQQEITGAGAAFPRALYAKMFDAYGREYGVRVNYQVLGSGGGIRLLINKTVDFGASDKVMEEEDVKAAGAPIVHVPVCAGAVVITYNLPGDPGLRLTPDIIAGIFLGKVSKWNDPKILSANRGVSMPDLPITVVHRSDGSGTTFVFGEYLGKVSRDWREAVGSGTALNWPTGLGAKGNPGVAGLVKQTPGSIGYVELTYALHNNMAYGAVKNRRGNFVRPSIASTGAAMNVSFPSDMTTNLTDTGAAAGYPLAGFKWILLYREQAYQNRSEAKAKELVRLIWWMTHAGQKYAEPLQYAPLSKAASTKAEGLIRSVTYNGKGLMK